MEQKKNASPVESARLELTSWKAIAHHLGVNIRTAQKWERDRGLPIRRSGVRGGVVPVSINGKKPSIRIIDSSVGISGRSDLKLQLRFDSSDAILSQSISTYCSGTWNSLKRQFLTELELSQRGRREAPFFDWPTTNHRNSNQMGLKSR